ncbi:hypothetical protein AGMMS50267_13220 [Spirochaetia bacterium]|nr:hypothetical protein AGMMS50267_13220 [Spirochaetia bacterium]
MAFCSKCGAQIAEGAQFCASCGTPVGGIAPSTPQQTTEKVGNIRKCPACGAEVPAMTAVCPSCGHEFSNVQANNTVQAFFQKLNEMEQDRVKQMSSISAAKMFWDNGRSTRASLDTAKAEMIKSFPIPNTKEDIVEFVLLASSQIQKKKGGLMASYVRTLDTAVGGVDFNDVWKSKCEQAYNKAKIVFGSDKDAIANIESILKEKKIIK